MCIHVVSGSKLTIETIDQLTLLTNLHYALSLTFLSRFYTHEKNKRKNITEHGTHLESKIRNIFC